VNKTFCPKCGKDKEGDYNGLCKSCFLDQLTLFECSSVLEMKVCPTCGAFFNEGKWSFDQSESVISSVVKKKLKIHKEAKNIDISLLPEFFEDKINVLVKIESTIRECYIFGCKKKA